MPHDLTECLDVGGGGIAEIDQEIAVHLRDLRVARRRPRQPAASISCQAFWPGGFLNVEPPVRLLIGCVASRDSVILPISAAIAGGIAKFAGEHGCVKI